ncbi:MAG TPA: ROK family transcriptional regulator [Anaerolineales bacterium]|nr:ROK family transcriptional regulator [Anaerolineales bacterium]
MNSWELLSSQTYDSTVSDPRIVRKTNKMAIVETVRMHQNGISRADTARFTNLSRATISVIVDELLEQGLLRETGIGASKGGRPPTILRLNANAWHVIGIDMGATHSRAMVANMEGQILAESNIPLDIASGPEACIDQVELQINELLANCGSDWKKIKAATLGVPGPVIQEAGAVFAPPIMPGWDGFPIRKYAQERWQIPVNIENDADLGVMGEWKFGRNGKADSLVYIKMGTGIGCGIILDGRLFRGKTGSAGEIGHTLVARNGLPCTCGNYGCLEAMAGGIALAQRAQMAVRVGQHTTLSRIPVETITARHVTQAAAQGDELCQQLLVEAGELVGRAVASLINLLNPGLITVSGMIVETGDFFMNALVKTAKSQCLKANSEATQIERAITEQRASALGAIAIANSTALSRILEM